MCFGKTSWTQHPSKSPPCHQKVMATTKSIQPDPPPDPLAPNMQWHTQGTGRKGGGGHGNKGWRGNRVMTTEQETSHMI